MIYFLHGVEILLLAYLIWKVKNLSTNPQVVAILTALAAVQASQNLVNQEINSLKDTVDQLARKFASGQPLSAQDLATILTSVNKLAAGADAQTAALKTVQTDAASPTSVGNPTSITVTPNPIELSLANQPTQQVAVLDSLQDDSTEDSTYTTDDPTIATVSSPGGLLTGVALGSTNLQTTDAFGNKSTTPVVVSA